VFKLKLVSELH